MDPGFAQFVELLKSGGNVALLAAAWMLWRVTHSLARIEAFISMIMEILLRSGNAKVSPEDMNTLRVMREQMRAGAKGVLK